MSAPDRAALREHLVRSRIAGDVDTTREDNLLKYGLLASRMPKAMFGLELAGRWNLDDVLALMVEKVGVSPDTSHLRGADRIDPDLTLDAPRPDGRARRPGGAGPVPGAAGHRSSRRAARRPAGSRGGAAARQGRPS